MDWTRQRQSAQLLEEDSGERGQGRSNATRVQNGQETRARPDGTFPQAQVSLCLSLAPQSDPEWIFRLFGHISIFFGFLCFVYLFVCFFKTKQKGKTHLFHQVARNCTRQHTSSFSICGCQVDGLLQSCD